jgi:hypothetical protein
MKQKLSDCGLFFIGAFLAVFVGCLFIILYRATGNEILIGPVRSISITGVICTILAVINLIRILRR